MAKTAMLSSLANDAPEGETVAGYRAPSSQFWADIMTTAIEGGINYWASISQVVRLDSGDPCRFVVRDAEDPNAFAAREVNAAVLIAGVEEIMKHDCNNLFVPYYIKKALENEDAGWVDALVADFIVQNGLFGKIVYG